MPAPNLLGNKFILALELEKAGKVALRMARKAEAMFDNSPLINPICVFESVVQAYPHYFRHNREVPRGLSAKWLCNPARWRARLRRELKQRSIALAQQVAGGCLIVPDALLQVRKRELNLSVKISASNAVSKGYFKNFELASNHLDKWSRLKRKRSSIFALANRAFADDSYLYLSVITVVDPLLSKCPLKAAAYLRAKANSIVACHRQEDPDLSFVTVFECHDSGVPHLNLLIFRKFKLVNIYPELYPCPFSRKESAALAHEVWEKPYYDRDEAFSKVKYYLKGFQNCNRSAREEAFFNAFGIKRFRVFDSQKYQRPPLKATAALASDDKSVQELSTTPRQFFDIESQATIRGFFTQYLANSMRLLGSTGKLWPSLEAHQLEIVNPELPDEPGQGWFFSDRFVVFWQELAKAVLPEPRAPPTRVVLKMAEPGSTCVCNE